MTQRRALTRRELLAASAGAALAISVPAYAAKTPGAGALRALRAAVRGRVYTPGTAGYNGARLLYNERFDGIRPKAVVQVADGKDIQAVVRWANRNDVALVARSGGNAYNGSSTIADGVVVDVGNLTRVSLRGGTATVGPGARLIQVYAALAGHRAAIPAGSCPNVAIGGHVLGGGMGLSGRAWGLALDQVQAFHVVTPAGAFKRVTPRSDEDLFWALSGGGGSFAFLYGIELAVHRARTAAWTQISWPGERSADVFAAWERLAPEAPPNATLLCTLEDGSVHVEGQYLGSEAALRSLIAPITAIDGANVSIGTSPWYSLMQRWAACAGSVAHCRSLPRTEFAAGSVYIADPLGSAGRAAFLEAADAGAVLICDAYGGAINDVDADATAFVHRDARFSVQIAKFGGPIGEARAVVRRARSLIAPFGDGQAYQNYPDLDQPSPLRAYYASNLARLKRIKAEVDPDRRLQPAQGI